VNPSCIIDCNHSNSNKNYDEQPRIVNEILHSRNSSKEIEKFVKGVMIESYIESGCQSVHEHVYGKSITDPCLGWDETAYLLYSMAEKL
nr:3-deoxy-7-phosphoheptulonate synthase [Lachnospiraceae bacterium]